MAKQLGSFLFSQYTLGSFFGAALMATPAVPFAPFLATAFVLGALVGVCK